MDRNKSVIKNTIWEMGYYLVIIILGFLAPRYIILYYNSEVNGLSSTITQMLNIILTLQAGATTAAIYSLYKPISDNDHESICKNVAIAENFFKKIAIMFWVMMVIVAVITPFILNTNLNKVSIFVAFVIMGIKSFVDLYFTSKFRIVFTVYQEKFYISIATMLEQVIYYALVFITIFSHWNFLFMYVWFLLSCILKVFFLQYVFKKKHPDIITKRYKRHANKIPGRNYALANEVSHSVVNSSIAIILSFMYGLEEMSVYSVYLLVSQALNLIATSIYSSFAPSFGNLVAQGDKESSSKVFLIFQYIYVMLNTFLVMCMLFLNIPFIKIYTSGVSDINYINYELTTMLVLSCLFSAYRIPYNIIVSSCGFFKETWLRTVIFAVLSIVISIVLGSINYSLIIAGSVVFYFLNFIYQHYKLKQLVPWLITKTTFGLLVISIVGIILTILLNSVVNFPEGIIYWIIYALLFGIVVLVYIILLSLLLFKNKLLNSLHYLKKVIKK